ncbi:hypothetical protein B0T26DRAFT_731405 [Lasiosphaeria miniovina]|uniref:Uncharacterized protein n=1 Tax=Lasiosphaeria miniovina TaxID=1954250 RepID=A0AA40DHM1_9PEZI|nr:uncharacterized protein B0T26DRAFT_731405 [Lasiosphaeria miniovina]KAK0703460.1 hypothetical protein B0T26DRAFT_731405 [Lasiosphaeria miniovina]
MIRILLGDGPPWRPRGEFTAYQRQQLSIVAAFTEGDMLALGIGQRNVVSDLVDAQVAEVEALKREFGVVSA